MLELPGANKQRAGVGLAERKGPAVSVWAPARQRSGVPHRLIARQREKRHTWWQLVCSPARHATRFVVVLPLPERV
jgi:hypothetical protein